MKILDKKFKLSISNQEIENRISSLAKELTVDYEGKDPIFVVLLNGAFMFAADLIRNIDLPCQTSFVKLSSYQGTKTTGKVKSVLGLEEEIAGKNIVIIDDIVDTGDTMRFIMHEIHKLNPKSIEPVALLLKPESFNNSFPLKYIGFSIPNNFVVGYGLDYDGYGRNLKDLYELDVL